MDDVVRRFLETEHGLKVGRRIGHGASAEVYEARSDQGVPCAVKVLLDPLDSKSPGVQKELENLNLVKTITGHPNIVTLMDVWLAAGYLVTRWELATEGSLLDYLRRCQEQGHRGIPLKDLMRFASDAAEGIDFLNQQSIYHRDIKPQNLLLFHGRVKLVDLGLAKFAGASTASHTGSGTWGYVPPEAHDLHRLEPTVDLYSLAATYVKLRTGREPFGESPVEVIDRQRAGDPVLDGLKPGEAELVRQALAPRPEGRPQYGAVRWVRSVRKAPRAKETQEVSAAQQQQEAAVKQWVGENAKVLWIDGDPDKGKTPLGDEFFVKAMELAEAGISNPIKQLTLALEFAQSRGRPTPRTPMLAAAQAGSVTCVAYGRQILTGSVDKTVKVWDVASGQELRALKGHTGSVLSVAFSPDWRWIVTGSQDDTAKVWEAASGQELLTLKGHTGWVTSVAFSPDRGRIVTGSVDKTKVWDVASGQELLALEGHTGRALSVAFRPDEWWIVTGSQDNTAKVWEVASGEEVLTLKGPAKVWDVDSGEELLTLEGHRGWVLAVAFSPDGRWIVTGSQDGTAKVWDVASSRELLTLKGHTGWVTSVAFSPDGRWIVTGSQDNTAKVWDVALVEKLLALGYDSVKELLTLKGHTGWVMSVAFSLDGARVVTASWDGSARLWDTKTGREICQQWHLPDGQWLVVTPAGYFHGSRDALRLVRHRKPDSEEFIDAEKSLSYYRPDLVREALAQQ